jgi:hypothetical protein
LAVLSLLADAGEDQPLVCIVDDAAITATQITNDVPVSSTSGSCRILDLVLGPLHLDLLGLVVDLNQLHLTITAQQGPGNPLCGIPNALNGGAGANVLANPLNPISAILG